MTRACAAVAAEVSPGGCRAGRGPHSEACARVSGVLPGGLLKDSPELGPRESADRQIRYQQVTGLKPGAGARVRTAGLPSTRSPALCTSLANVQLASGHIRWRVRPRTKISAGRTRVAGPLTPVARRMGPAVRSAVRPAWIAGCERPPRLLLGVVLFPFEEVHVVTQQDE